jgi:hypothetical protein
MHGPSGLSPGSDTGHRSRRHPMELSWRRWLMVIMSTHPLMAEQVGHSERRLAAALGPPSPLHPMEPFSPPGRMVDISIPQPIVELPGHSALDRSTTCGSQSRPHLTGRSSPRWIEIMAISILRPIAELPGRKELDLASTSGPLSPPHRMERS